MDGQKFQCTYNITATEQNKIFCETRQLLHMRFIWGEVKVDGSGWRGIGEGGRGAESGEGNVSVGRWMRMAGESRWRMEEGVELSVDGKRWMGEVERKDVGSVQRKLCTIARGKWIFLSGYCLPITGKSSFLGAF